MRYSLIVLFFAVSIGRTTSTDDRKEELKTTVKFDARFDCRYLPDDEKAYLRSLFYEIKKASNNPKARDYQQLQIGDEATIERYIREYYETGHFGLAVDMSGQARFIEVMAETLFRNEPYVETKGDVRMPPPSYGVTYNIVQILRDSPQLSFEVRNWAHTLDSTDPITNRTILRKWWRENEHHFEEKNYMAVQPGFEGSSEASEEPDPRAAPAAASSPPAPATSIAVSSPVDSTPSRALLLIVAIFS